MLFTQPIKSPRNRAAEYISVMSRHTLEDGVTLDTEISLDGVDHRVQLAPPPKLVGDWYRGRLGSRTREAFEGTFAPRYIDHLTAQIEEVRRLGHAALTRDVVIMCIEETCRSPKDLLCHRRLLAEYCLNLYPDLQIRIE